MTRAELEARIKKIRDRPLVLLCRTPDGREKEMTVAECIETGSSFLHLVDDDLDALLADGLEVVKESRKAQKKERKNRRKEIQMENIKLNVETTDTTRQKAARAFGLDTPSVLDVLKRSDYMSDEEFLDACVRFEMERDSEQYRATRRRLAAEMEARREDAEREAQDTAFREVRSATVLDYTDKKEIDAKAAERARADLAAGRIAASELGATIERYAGEMSEHAKDVKAGNALLNSLIRAAHGGGDR